MAFIEAPTNFYLGRVYDPSTNQLGEDVVYYDSRDLTTHAVVVGMTGSGKTGLCITLLEEAILDNIPAIIIDPKGDITNLALTFPGLSPQEFRPWIDEDDARRANMSPDQFAAHEAAKWRDGLARWGIVPDRLKWLKLATRLNIYTPGSDTGLPISILASLRAPRLDWNTQGELIRERINGVVTAIYALAGMNMRPVTDEPHVLMSNIIEYNWRMGRDLTIEDIIMQIKQPPFEKLGVFQIDQYIDEKKRYKLAMELNSVIAAPSFQSWITGEPLDIQHLLYTPNGQPKVSVFYIAHLSEQERMFIMTLLLESMNAWMRMQSGTSSLRALLYVDEMFGYFPPYPKNPPSKDPLMRLLKQARAFGVGLVLATQNPGDLDYKGLTNAGTWFIGRLQSENDYKKVVAGLRELATVNDDVSVDEVSQLIADLRPRVFLMRNVHNRGGSLLVHSRWAMNYLTGPLARPQIAALMADKRRQLYAQMQPQTPAHFALQQNPWQQAQQGFYNAPPPPMGFDSGGFGAQAAPGMPPPPMPGNTPPQGMPPAPGFNPQPGFGEQGFNQQGFNQQGFNAQNMPAPPMGNPAAGGLTPRTPGNRLMSSDRLPGGFMQTPTPPPIQGDTDQFFLPTSMTEQQAFARAGQQFGGGQILLAYVPVLLAQTTVRYSQKTAQIYTMRQYAFHIPELQASGLVHWDQHSAPVVNSREVRREPFNAGATIYGEPSAGLTDPKRMKALQNDLTDFLYNTARLVIPMHKQFKLYGDPDGDMSEFQARITQQAREGRDAEIDKLNTKYGTAMDKLEDKLRQKEREYEAEKLEIRDRRREQLYTTGEAVLSIFQGRTNYTLSRMSRANRYKRQTEADIQESREVIREIEREMADLEMDYEQQLQAINQKWIEIAAQVEELTITPFKKDISLDMFGVGWIPHYYTLLGNQPLVVPAFG